MSRNRRRSKSRRRRKAARRAAAEKQALVPWRRQMAAFLDGLRTWSRDHYPETLDAHLAAVFGDPPEAERPEDLRRATDDCICQPGSAGDGLSILRVFCDQASGFEPDLREQARRWERERRRGVLVVQRAGEDRLVLWDPLEGAPLTLHLLDKLGAATVRRAAPGAVATATYQPWMARLVAVEEPEFFSDPRALALFRTESTSSGARWHEPPAPAPERTRAATSSAP